MLTESQLRAAIKQAATGTKDQVILKDGGARGSGRLTFIARRLSTRIATEWYAQYHQDGKRKLAKLGNYPDLSLAAAREKFRDEYAPTIQIGAEVKNPYARKCNKKISTVATVEELFRAYVDDLRDQGKAGASYIAERILLMREDSVAKFLGADRAANEVKPDEIVAYLASVHARGAAGMAGNMRSYIRSAFEWGIKAGKDYTRQSVTYDFGLTVNPANAIPTDPNANKVGERWLSPAEFKAFHDWLMANRWRSHLCNVLLLCLFTGQRIKEITLLTRENYDPVERIAYWPETKNGRPHSILLCTRAAQVMDTLLLNKAGVFFPRRFAHERSARLNGPAKVVDMYLAETGTDKFVARDLRRTWKTLAGHAGLTKSVRDRYQNHAAQGSRIATRHYDRYDMLPEMREGMLQWDRWLDGCLDAAKPLSHNAVDQVVGAES